MKTSFQDLWDAVKAVDSYTGLPPETRKIPSKQSNSTPKRTRTNKTQGRKLLRSQWEQKF